MGISSQRRYGFQFLLLSLKISCAQGWAPKITFWPFLGPSRCGKLLCQCQSLSFQAVQTVCFGFASQIPNGEVEKSSKKKKKKKSKVSSVCSAGRQNQKQTNNIFCGSGGPAARTFFVLLTIMKINVVVCPQSQNKYFVVRVDPQR